MTEQELIDAITLHVRCSLGRGTSRKDVEAVLSGLAVTVNDALRQGGDVPLPGIGRLVMRERPARQGRNPHTGAVVTIPAWRSAQLRVARKLKDSLKG